ncbi:tRNA1(Val) (adenine(37)-N6)-methyltransferase [Spirosoma aerophilum]
MKVCTDACILGAYADVIEEGTSADRVDQEFRILDIGAGTGLLALMAAQRNPRALLDAVEVDEAAFGQATENVAASPFASQVKVRRGRIQDYQPGLRYDRILTNPPFYTNHLHSPNIAVNRALHTDELSFSDLIRAVERLMKPYGQWWVLLPPYEMETLTGLAAQTGLYPFRHLRVKHNAEKQVFRHITGFCFEKRTVDEETLVIFEQSKTAIGAEKQPKETYTSEFSILLRDFYLIF